MNVKVYSTTSCPYCVKVKEFLTENKVDFEDIDVTTDQVTGQMLINKTGQMGVPVTIVNDGVEHIIIGFQPEKIKEILKL